MTTWGARFKVLERLVLCLRLRDTPHTWIRGVGAERLLHVSCDGEIDVVLVSFGRGLDVPRGQKFGAAGLVRLDWVFVGNHLLSIITLTLLIEHGSGNYMR